MAVLSIEDQQGSPWSRARFRRTSDFADGGGERVGVVAQTALSPD
jgi:hypothetical protein